MLNAYSHAANLIKLDDLYDKFGPFNNIKIDIDGNELDLVNGAKKTLSNLELKSILIELNEKDESFEKIIQIVKSNSFKINEYLTNKSYVSTKRSSKIYNIIFER